MEQARKRGRAFLSVVLSILLAVGGVTFLSSGNEAHAATSAVANPTPKIDIAVTVPADYPGTFLDFKAELEQKLRSEGLSPDDFRITNSAVQIDTTDTSDWYVYDHYKDASAYNTVTSGFTAEQKAKQPQRLVTNASGSTSYATIEAAYKANAQLSTAYAFRNHIYSFQDAAGKASMVFAGYYYSAADLVDYMIYPAASDSRRTFSFDVDSSKVLTHSMYGAGFFLNAGITSAGKLQGYIMYMNFTSESTGNMYILKVNDNVNASTFALHTGSTSFTNVSTVHGPVAFNLGSAKKARFDVDLQKDKVSVEQTNYDSSNRLEPTVTKVFDKKTLAVNGQNGFGPLVAYAVSGHTCGTTSAFTFTDLEMTYEASAFDSLKSSQFYEDADYKYFINLAGTENDPAIPDISDADGKQSFDQGIERLAKSKIFYVSNWNDGYVLTDQGVTTANGLYATSSDYVGQIARYIATNYKENVQYDSSVGNTSVEKPLANLVVRAKSEDTSAGGKDVQAITLHLAHLKNNEYVDVYVDGKNSIPSTGNTINGYQLRVFDPNNNIALDTTGGGNTWITSLDELKTKTQRFDKTTTQGRWTFELTVRDSSGAVSTACQTFLTVYNDTVVPSVSFKGHGRESKVTITLTDHGYGIDSDGITLLPDQGSGVVRYKINDNAPVEVPGAPLHEYSFTENLSELEIYAVTVWDECGNTYEYGYNTTRVEFVDESGRRLDTKDPQYATYYVPWDQVSGGSEIGELPRVPEAAASIPPKYPAGWVQVGGKRNGQIIGPNTTIQSMLDLATVSTSARVITLKPVYTTKSVKLTFDGKGGTFAGSAPTKEVFVAEGSAISQGLLSGNDVPTMTGHVFDGWVMGSGNQAATSEDGSVTITAAEVAEGTAITTQQAVVSNAATDTITLKATWRIGEYDLKFDANGGTLGTLKKRTLQYGDSILPATQRDQAGNEYKGNSFPTREGYIFDGWAADKAGAAIPSDLAMSENGYTVYAKWTKDTRRYVIHFNLNNMEDNDSNVDTMLNDVSRLKASEATYPTMPTPSRAGYTFDGWYTERVGGDKKEVTNAVDTSVVGTNGNGGSGEVTLYAHWTPVPVKYSVVYYVKQSSKDGDYVRYDTVTHNATTGTQVDLLSEDKKATLSSTNANVAGYWFNPNPTGVTTNHNETLKVKGDGSTRFNLYYDRVLTVTTSASEGGTVTPGTFTKNEGENAQVSWTANEGYRVKSVLVDGQVRDDLKAGGTCDFDGQPITDNRSVRVVFEKIPETPSGSGGSGGTVTPPARKAYTVSTQIVGCGSSAGCSITPTAVYTAGSTATVDWTLCGACTVSTIEVDGEVVADAQNGPIATSTLSFTGIAADHSVVVTMADSGRPTLGGGTGTGSTPANDGFYTITVNRYGGDDKFTTSSTRTVPYASAARDEWKFTWDEGESEYRIAEIRVNNGAAGVGGAVYGGEGGLPLPADKAITLGNRAPRNYVVDVYLSKELNKPEDPTSGYKVPDLSKPDEWVTVTTEIVGGAGEITGSFVAKKEELPEHTVTYKLGNKDNYSASDYAYYKVEKVLVNGKDAKEITDGSCTVEEKESEGEITVKLTQDAVVKVVVEPVTFLVQTLAVTADADGTVQPSASIGGSLSASRRVGKYGNYTELMAMPRGNYRIGAVEVSTENGPKTYYFSGKGATGTLLNPQASASSYSISDVPRLANGVFANGEALADDATPLASLAQLLGVEQAWADEAPGLVLNGDSANQNVYLYGATAETLSETPKLDSDGYLEMTIRNVTDDQRVVVYFVAESANEEGVKVIVGDRDKNLHLVTANIVGEDGITPVPGAAVEGAGFVPAGSDPDLAIRVPTGYQVVSYTVGENTIEVSEDEGRPSNGRFNIQLEPIAGDVTVLVKMVPVERPTNPVLPSGFNPTHQVITTAKGYGALSITPTTTLPAGSNHQVDWAVQSAAAPLAEDAAPVNEPFIIKIEVDAKATKRVGGDFYLNDEAAENGTPFSSAYGGSVNFANLSDTHQVAVTSILLNEDTDGDGKPDLNVTDENGIPKKNIDTNGDGVPDIEIEIKLPDGTTTVVNHDTNGDDEPDVNIVDTDGDGKPDSVDPTKPNPPLPNVNVDTNDDGKPDLNVDTTGDGIPDLNIVAGDDGKPIGINPNNPPLPNVNVDTNNDGKPDLNVDTTGDGKPDKNIVAGDDGKPIGIDPKDPNPPAPNVNIVVPDPTDPTNPDKTIVINKDVDGDGIPDINIDTDGDGVPDVNIDTNGDNIPDVNIDTDGTGQWKPSTMGGNKDGIWKPDTAIDTGDGKGPVHYDYTDPVDKDGDGVDDRWEPVHKDGDGYGMVRDNWTQDAKQPDDNGGNGLLPSGPGDGNGGNGAGNGNGNGAGDGNGGNGALPTTGDTNNGGAGNGANTTAWNPLLSQTGQSLSQTADENLPTILMVGAAFVVSSLIVAAARRRRRGDDL